MFATSALILKQMIVFKYNISHMQTDKRFFPSLFLEDSVRRHNTSTMYLMKAEEGFSDFPYRLFSFFLLEPTGILQGPRVYIKINYEPASELIPFLLQGK